VTHGTSRSYSPGTMYTNIDSAHTLEVLHPFLRTSPLCTGYQADAITIALEILIHQNIFNFDDTFWRQKSGTAMGTPLGGNYSELYYGTRKLGFADYCCTSLALYCRYIDHDIGLWIHHLDVHQPIQLHCPSSQHEAFKKIGIRTLHKLF
jgi:hypothetical protein